MIFKVLVTILIIIYRKTHYVRNILILIKANDSIELSEFILITFF